MVHLKVLKVIKELFLTSLLPNRKIHYLDRQLLTLDIACQNDISDKSLLYLYFEDCLKRRFKKFLELLKTCSVDGEDYIKEASINTLYHLLINKPEQEKAILSLIINKIKDPNRKIASKTCYLMTCLIIKHPKMQSVILSEVGKLIILSNSSLRSKIYATILLNQMVLTYVSKRTELTHILMNLYLTGLDKIFKDKFGDTKMIITYNNHKSTKLYWKLIHELLMGVNRVFPFASDFNSKMWISRNITNLIFIVRSDSYNTGSQALLMLYKFSVLYDEFSHRLYAVLYDVLRYKSMIRVINSNIIFSTLFKMIKKDLLSKRVEAFVKRMLEVALVISTTLAGVILVIISKLIRIHKVIWKNIFQLDKRHIEHKFIKEFTPNQNLKGFVALFIRSKPTNEKKLGMRTIMQFLTQSLHEVNYDQTKLTAIYSKTKFSCFWELLLIANHVHPKIAAMSRIILDGKTISLQHFDSRY
jgi:ribosome biogenesis protein MAK21